MARKVRVLAYMDVEVEDGTKREMMKEASEKVMREGMDNPDGIKDIFIPNQ